MKDVPLPGPAEPAASGRGARPARVAAAVLLVLHAAAGWIGRAPGILTGQDDALYIGLARAILQGTYRDLHRIDAPLHALYPPGYPALLAGWGSIAGFGFDGLVLLNVVCTTLALALIWDATARLFSPWLALAVLAPLALNPLLLEASGQIASEAPYLLATVLPLWGLARGRGRGRALSVAAIAVVALFASITRAVGIALLAALVLELALCRAWRRAAVMAVISATLFGGWLAWSRHVGRESESKSYVVTAPMTAIEAEVEQSGGGAGKAIALVRRMAGHAHYYATRGVPWGMAVPTVPGTVVDNAVTASLVVGTGLAGLLLLLARWRIAALYLVAYSGILVLYPWVQDRFVVPIAPIAVIASVVGAHRLVRRRPRALRIAVPVLLSAMLVAGGVRRSLPVLRANAGCDRGGPLPDPACMAADQASWFDAVRWVDRNLPPDAVFLTMKPEPLFHYTGRRSIANLDVTLPPESAFLPRILERGGQYILLGSLQSQEPGWLSRRLLANCDQITLVAFFGPRTWLFRVGPPPDRDARRASCEAMVRYRWMNLGRNFAADS